MISVCGISETSSFSYTTNQSKQSNEGVMEVLTTDTSLWMSELPAEPGSPGSREDELESQPELEYFWGEEELWPEGILFQ